MATENNVNRNGVTTNSNSAIGTVQNSKGQQVSVAISKIGYENELAKVRKKNEDDNFHSTIRHLNDEIAKQEAIKKSETDTAEAKARATAELAVLQQSLDKAKQDAENAYAQQAIQNAYNIYQINSNLNKQEFSARIAQNEELKKYAEEQKQLAANRKSEIEYDIAAKTEETRNTRYQAHIAAGMSESDAAAAANADAIKVSAELTRQFAEELRQCTASVDRFAAEAEAADKTLKDYEDIKAQAATENLSGPAKLKKQAEQKAAKAQENSTKAQEKLNNATAARMAKEQEIANKGNVSDEERASDAEELATLTAKESAAKSEVAATSAASFQAQLLVNAIDAGMQAVGKAIAKLGNDVDDALDDIKSGQAEFNARIQGSQQISSMQEALKDVRINLGYSGLITQKDMIANLREIVSLGVSYNVEQRAFLETVADKIATTFDAFDSNLLRIIRLQQADSTQARLGMEANLTQFFNSMYMDTSYLGTGSSGGMYDTVYANLIEATSQMTRNQTISFEYNVQKWLGSLSSLGLSDNSVTKISEAIGYLASGDVTSLSSNTEMSNLLAISAANAGLDYAKLLTNGMESDTVNKLLESMVSYLKEIAETEDNLVVKQAYGDVFGLTMSDFRALSNLTDNDLSVISNTNLNYTGAMLETSKQLILAQIRTPIAEIVSNLYENFVYSTATDIASNPLLYTTWLLNDLVEDATGGIAIPAISVAGFGIDLNTTVTALAKVAMIGISTVASIPNIISSIASIGTALGVNTWNGSDYTWRGQGFTGITAGSIKDTSLSAQVGSSSYSDFSNSTVGDAVEDSESLTSIDEKVTEMQEEAEGEKDITDVYERMDEGFAALSESIATLNTTLENRIIFGG